MPIESPVTNRLGEPSGCATSLNETSMTLSVVYEALGSERPSALVIFDRQDELRAPLGQRRLTRLRLVLSFLVRVLGLDCRVAVAKASGDLGLGGAKSGDRVITW